MAYKKKQDTFSLLETAFLLVVITGSAAAASGVVIAICGIILNALGIDT